MCDEVVVVDGISDPMPELCEDLSSDFKDSWHLQKREKSKSSMKGASGPPPTNYSQKTVSGRKRKEREDSNFASQNSSPAKTSKMEGALTSTCCQFCLLNPCVAKREEILISSASGVGNKEKRFEIYCNFSKVLGTKWKRKKLPLCVTDAASASWPDPEGHYKGFKK
jgi:hypothetical protein